MRAACGSWQFVIDAWEKNLAWPRCALVGRIPYCSWTKRCKRSFPFPDCHWFCWHCNINIVSVLNSLILHWFWFLSSLWSLNYAFLSIFFNAIYMPNYYWVVSGVGNPLRTYKAFNSMRCNFLKSKWLLKQILRNFKRCFAKASLKNPNKQKTRNR